MKMAVLSSAPNQSKARTIQAIGGTPIKMVTNGRTAIDNVADSPDKVPKRLPNVIAKPKPTNAR
ncbi:protein of unknown function [Vibrio tapetis subsp. tapetis]|uniref:Uncharacterized protein n=1 Tax=Vibrio tapetis subsp. tapetis TaxID=1671868 RepID=A0A2N8ZDA4_9VIBR|nr:protein of unknown function [Vibrio tapetis subsp. tapetis]